MLLTFLIESVLSVFFLAARQALKDFLFGEKGEKMPTGIR